MTDIELEEEFRMAISHALLGYEDNAPKEAWDLVFKECVKITKNVQRGSTQTKEENNRMLDM